MKHSEESLSHQVEKRHQSKASTNGVNGVVNGIHPKRTLTPSKRDSVMNGSPLSKKRKIVHVQDDNEDDNSLQFAPPQTGVNGILGQGVKKRRDSSAKASLLEQRMHLPIWSGKDGIVQAIRENDTVVILGETGSGKTTQVPQFLLESNFAGKGVIAVTQPRKVAATSLAMRVSEEQGTLLGGLVGYSVRFDEKSSGDTKIKYLTDGMLMRELLSDPLLSKYTVVIVDEAHERTLRTDVLLASLKGIQKQRNAVERSGKQNGSTTTSNPLKVVIMSASLEAEKFSRFFNNAKILYVKGRQHPVKILYTADPQPDYVDSALRTFFQIHMDRPPGDVLIFLPGQEDIESLQKSIELYTAQLPLGAQQVVVYPMYAALPPAQQAKAFTPAPTKTRKCILATNIAETSITIPGVKYVIDSGVCKEKTYQARDRGSGVEMLLVRPISKSSALQRAGRAGRDGPGFCFRLYTERTFNSLKETILPEIQRCNLTFAVLQLKSLGQDPENIDFMDSPSEESLRASLISLFKLQALDKSAKITAMGREMASYPLDPPLARALIESEQNGCIREVVDILAMLSASSTVFFTPLEKQDEAMEARSKFRHPSGDHMTLLNILRSYMEISQVESKAGRRHWCQSHFLNERTLCEALEIRKQLHGACERVGLDWETSSGEEADPVLKSLFRGLCQNSALVQPDGTYKQALGHAPVKIHPTSSLMGRKVAAIFYDELVFTTQTYARGVSSIPRAWVLEVLVGSPNA